MKTSTAKLSSHIFRPQASWLNQMESSMGQMSNQWEREGHAKKLAGTVMWAHGGLNLHSNSSKEQQVHIKTRVSRVGMGQVGMRPIPGHILKHLVADVNSSISFPEYLWMRLFFFRIKEPSYFWYSL